jgi:hypothetical protein
MADTNWGTSGGFGGGGSSGGPKPAVGWKDGLGWLDENGNPTTATPRDEADMRRVLAEASARTAPVNLSDGNPNTSTSVVVPGQPVQAVGQTSGNSTTYRAGIDDRPWTNVAQPSAYLYGGVPGGATNEVNRYTGLASMADSRQAPQIAGNQYGRQFGGDMATEASSRGNQLYGLNQLQGIIEGRGPSVAQQQQNIGLAQAMQQQRAIAASARGGGANLAAAQQAASNAAAGLSGNAFAQGGLLRAQEQSGAINNYGGLANAMRGSDQARAQLTGQMANSQASLDLQSRNANDSRNLAYEQMRRGVFQDQMGARQAGEAMNAGIVQQNADRSQRADEHADAERDKYVGAGLAAGGAVVGTMIAPGAGTAAGAAIGNSLSDVRAKKNIGDGAEAVRATIGAAAPYTYDYKNPKDGQGRRIGVMAQDLERGPLGKEVVRTGPDGQKVIDGPRGLSLALASSADQEQRLRQLEARTASPDQRNFPAEQSEMRGLSAMAQQGQPASVGAVQPTDFGDAKMNAAGNAALVEHIAAQRRPVTLAEYQAIAKMPSSPEVDLFRQRPEFAGYGNVEGYAEPFQALPGSGLSRITPPSASRKVAKR